MLLVSGFQPIMRCGIIKQIDCDKNSQYYGTKLIRAFSALAEKSGEDNFKQAGEYMFFGGVLTIVFVGIIGFFIGWMLAFKGFSSMKPKSSQINLIQETPSNQCHMRKQTMNCSECGKEIPIDKKLCEECKKRLLR